LDFVTLFLWENFGKNTAEMNEEPVPVPPDRPALKSDDDEVTVQLL